MLKKYYFTDNEILGGKDKTDVKGFETIDYIEYEAGCKNFDAYNIEGDYITIEIHSEDSEILEQIEKEGKLTAGKILNTAWLGYTF